MRKMYQTEWQNISFASFAELDSRHLADAKFYEAFYHELFRRYSDWSELSAAWRAEKQEIARFIARQPDATRRVLSVGCGLGAVEHYLLKERLSSELYIHEVAPTAWRWIGSEVSANRKFLGSIPGCLPPDLRFDLVYLSAVDYALNETELVGLLAALLSRLVHGGRCLIFSASFEIEPVSVPQKIASVLRRLKWAGLAALDAGGLRWRGQFWGWMRTASEYRLAMAAAGYGEISCGNVSIAKPSSFWIAGRRT